MIKRSFLLSLLLVAACLVLAAHGLGPAHLRTDLGKRVRSPASVNDHVRGLRSAMIDESVAALPYCVATTCASLGQTCANNGSITCIGGTQCYASGSSTPTCVNPIPVGQNCYVFGLSCADNAQCANGVCQPFSNSDPGDKCTHDNECDDLSDTNISGPFGTCVNGRCYGIPIGGPCNNTQSAFNSGCLNSYCNSKTLKCTPYGKTGDPCTDSDQCLLACTNGACGLNAFSPVGGNCTDSGCVSGSYCGTDDVCHSAKDITNAPCSNDADCTNGLYCSCNSISGSGVCSTQLIDYDTFYSSFLNYVKCSDSNNCNQLNYQDQCTACASLYCAAVTSSLNLNLGVVSPIQPACVINDQQASICASYQQDFAEAGCSSPNSASAILKGVSTLMFVIVALSVNLF